MEERNNKTEPEVLGKPGTLPETETRPETVTKVLEQRLNLIKSGEYREVDMPWPLLTEMTNALYPGTVTLFCGTPGASKSLMWLNAVMTWAKEGIKASMYQMEGDIEYHMFRALCQKTAVNSLLDIKWARENHEEVQKMLDDNCDFIEDFSSSIHTTEHENISYNSVLHWLEEQAKAGSRIIIIDPVTMIPSSSSQSWDEEKQFISKCEQIARQYLCSIVFVTHPTKSLPKKPGLTHLSGSAAYPRFSHTIMWLEKHQAMNSRIRKDGLTESLSHDRTVHILKARNSDGEGYKVAFEFIAENLTLNELGIIVKG